MNLFGGDPRSVQLQTLFVFNRYYSLIAFIVILCTIPYRSTDITLIVMFIFFFVIELARVILVESYRRGSIENVFIFITISIIPTIILDILWMFFVDSREGIDYAIMIGFCILHLIEIILCCVYSVKLNQFTTRFNRFIYPENSLKVDLNEENKIH